MLNRETILQIFKASPIPTSILQAQDDGFIFLTCNDAFLEMTGRGLEEVSGRFLLDALPPEADEGLPVGVSRFIESLQKVISTKKPVELDTIRYDIAIGNGKYEERYFQVSNTPVFTDNDKVEFIINNAVDITYQVLSERMNKMMLENTEDSFIYLDTNFHILNFNDKFKKKYQEVFGKQVKKSDSMLNITVPERINILENILNQVLSGETIEDHLAFETPGGDKRYFQSKYKPAKDEYGNIIGIFISFIEETEAYKAKLEIETREARFRALVENGNDVVIILAPDGKPKYVSPSIKKVLGYDIEEALHFDISGIVHPDDQKHVQQEIGKCLSLPGVPVKVTPARMKHKDGSWRWFEGTITNLLDDPAVNGIVDNFTEITHRKKAEMEREFERRNTEALINSTNDLVWSINKDFRLITANSAFLKSVNEQLGVDIHLGESIMKGTPENSLKEQRWTSFYNRALSGEAFLIETQEEASETDTIYYETSFNPIYENDEVTGVACFARDTTQAKKAKEKLLDAEKKYRNVVEHSTNMFYQHDTDGMVTYVSPQSMDFLGYSPEEILVKWTDFTTNHPVNKKGMKITQKAIDTGQIQPPYELQLNKKNGEVAWVEVNEAPLKKDGKVVGIVGSLTDITDRKQNERQIRNSLKEKETLLAEIHHRVKNNLAVVSGMMQLQTYESKNEILRNYLLDSISRIQTMATVHELLYQSNSFSELEFSETLERLVTSISDTFHNGEHISLKIHSEKVKLNINQAIPASLIVNEVVTNAYKHAFTDQGEGSIQFVLAKDENCIKIEIKDNGCGIPENSGNPSSLGLHLIHLLSEQIEGKYEYKAVETGTSFKLEFKPEEQNSSIEEMSFNSVK